MAKTKMNPSRLFFHMQSSVTKSYWPKSVGAVRACGVCDGHDEFLIVEICRSCEVSLEGWVIVLCKLFFDETARYV
jgi:serine/threonine protein phosphatase PrpC